MNITLNGEEKTLSGRLSVAAAMAELALTSARVAIELNGRIVPRSCHGEVMLTEGDRVEIVHFIGGG